MKRTIKWQLLLSFVSLSFILVGAFSWITLNLLESHFADYVRERQESELEEYSTDLENLYQQNGTWEENSQAIQRVGRNALQQSVIVRIFDEDGQLLWSPSASEEEDAKNKVQDHLLHMEQMVGGMESDYVQSRSPLYDGTEEIGMMEIQSVGPYAYTEHDALFISDMESKLVLVAFFSLLIPLFFALLVAKKLSSPIVTINDFTKEIAKGRYSSLSLEETGIREIDDLLVSVNDLSLQLQYQQKIRNRLSSDIAHEIRTPLTTLKGNIEAMIDGVWEISEERLYRCYEEVSRITRLIGEIDRINELESQESQLQKNTFDLTELAQQIVDNFQPMLVENKLNCSVSGDRVFISADRDKIHQVLTNLLANAIKFTPSGGRIDLYVSQSKGTTSFRIIDNGQGIPPDEVGQIFERFYMAEPSRNSKLRGQGIGLSIVKGIVNAHQGTISVDSIYGKGTTFTINLPMAK
ncbi:Signal transduction histidine-protein kinase BaeS [bioreactor metagenome]|uniref:histidine kinase n=1 Tax=bioreactor metagenome TaxID=1076179 RepID=A0A644WGT5_9ZZZZ